MPPSERIVVAHVETPIGRLTAGAVHDGICLLEFPGGRARVEIHDLAQRLRATVADGSHEHLRRLARELDAYFAGRLRRFTVPLAAPGTAFEEAVWKHLLRIPYGETISYTELAARVGKPSATRAVGSANGRNRIAIVIPCHRVVNSNGKLGGYGGGLWRKQQLLELEGALQQPRLIAS
jgi:AraC family transcriptional regulator of adaptative response/methylated-DNA-[protein]-cysteine methyltransferase